MQKNAENTIRNREQSPKKSRSFIFSPVFLISLILILEAAALFWVFSVFGNYLYWFFGGTHFLAILMVIYFLNHPQNDSVKLTWVILVLVAPTFAIPLYWFIETNFVWSFARKKFGNLDISFENQLAQDPNVLEALADKSPSLNLLNLASPHSCLYAQTSVQYYENGGRMYQAMLEKLQEAKEFIFLEYFIISLGQMWGGILEILKQKVQEGVEVRVMYDGTCSFASLPYSYPKFLEKYGIQVKVFAPIMPFLSLHYNNRDHRKIMVIDGKYAFSGGINLADEYINLIKKYGHWKDTGFMLSGKAVDAFTVMFLTMWNASKKESEEISGYIKNFTQKSDGYMMPYGTNPFKKDLLAEKIYIEIINCARDYLFITTPYLIVDQNVIFALKLASERGVDVRLVLPHIPDKEMAFALAHTHYKELLEAKVRIYEYTPGFIHAKMFVSDDEKAIVGTINLDYRSLYHHFECAVYFYQSSIVFDVKNDIRNLFNISQEICLDDLHRDSVMRKLKGKLLKVLAPLM